jgi:anaerobic magnesium-protoporphyrin IX monomethyl ester cyclase
MNVSLVRPNFSTEQGTIYPPLGLLTLASYFDKKHTIYFADQQMNGINFLGNKFDVICFSAFTNQLLNVEKLIRQGKDFGVKSKFVVGGPAITSNPEYAKKLVPSADLFFAGDGEYFAENIENFDGAKIADYRKTPYPLDNKKVPAWDLINYNQYVKTVGLGVETSRGCPFNCVMCTAHLIHGKQWVPRKPKDIVDELRILKQKFHCSKFYFADDNATVDPSRWFNLMHNIALSKLDLKLNVPEGIQAHNLDVETLVEMWQAGLRHFTIGAESGSQRVLDKVINKGGLTVEKIEEVVKHAVHLHMKPSCFFVIGFPGETLEEAKATVDFAEKLRRLGAESCTVRNAIPIPGTRMFEIAKKEGYLIVPEDKLFDFKFIHNSKHLLITSEWKPEQIDALVSKAQQQEKKHIIRSNIFKHPRATLNLLMSKS